MSNRIDLVGNHYGRLHVQRFVGRDKFQRALWKCLCICGRTTIVASANLRQGYTKSCGCLWNEMNQGITLNENGKQTHLYQIWNGMKQRCSNKNHAGYHNYGGRGIAVCKQWQRFSSFYKWSIANGYIDGLSINRINSERGYEPSNCHWTPRNAQGRNTRRLHLVTHKGETHSLAEWSRLTGINYSALCARIRRGWGPTRLLTEPLHTEFARRYKGEAVCFRTR